MKSFDALKEDIPLFGPHLLEASAGTGKTFSIEHIFTRLILEGVELEQILCVTFTKASSRELLDRIRKTLQKALQKVREKEAIWPYLTPYLTEPNAFFRLKGALLGFERCQIFTIHGFCLRMLREFFLETEGFETVEDEEDYWELLRGACLDFLENAVTKDLLSDAQLVLLSKEVLSLEELIEKLLRGRGKKSSQTFSDLYLTYKEKMRGVRPLEEKKLSEDFSSLAPNYKAGIKGDFPGQIKALCQEDERDAFSFLLREKGTIFDFLHPDRKKKKALAPSHLHYPGFFDWGREQVAFIFKKKVFPILLEAWEKVKENFLDSQGLLDPDRILKKMRQAMEKPSFAEAIREKYRAVIVDEFQDTDRDQWAIFQTLLESKTMRAFYLVGDPKQSIYRFRNADLYTYFRAREFLGEENLYHLDTNYRSSKPLIEALNALFKRDWIELPALKKTFSYHPVKAGMEKTSSFQDGKGAIHFMFAEGDFSQLFETLFLPYIANEIQGFEKKRCAILVKDRYQMAIAQRVLERWNIPWIAKNHTPLGKTRAFSALYDLFQALYSPKDKSYRRLVAYGPFADRVKHLPELREILEKKGLGFLARELDLDAEGIEVFEHLFAFERKEGVSLEGLKKAFEKIRRLSPEQAARKSYGEKTDAVEILTLHISKGLEFDVVFAPALAARGREEAEELEEVQAEKKRQLYVAMTRAKERLYIPASLKESAHSCLDLFFSHFSLPMEEELKILGKKVSITRETIETPPEPPPFSQKGKSEKEAKKAVFPPVHSSFLYSFSTLARKQEEKRIALEEEGMLPKGAKTGRYLHALFEALFRSRKKPWQKDTDTEEFIDAFLQNTFLSPWTLSIQEMVKKVIGKPFLPGFSLSILEPEDLGVEMEFVYEKSPHFIKGFIDLVFRLRGRLYFIDWKSNVLEGEEDMEKKMRENDYYLQASLYKEALQRGFREEFASAYYVFLRNAKFFEVP